MRRPDSAAIAREGVGRTRLAVEEELKWLFREQATDDYGIDAQIEVVENGEVQGRLLAVQIKSGESWFREPASSGGWWFRPDQSHVDYWLRHSLPVVIVLYSPKSQACYWELVTRSNLVPTRTGGAKLRVPADQLLDRSAVRSLSAASEGDPYVLRLRELQLARPWMARLDAGERLVVEIEEWVNKSSGRGSIQLGVDREDGQRPEVLAAWDVLLGSSGYGSVVPGLFAWAEIGLHEETYERADENQYESESVFFVGESVQYQETFAEWSARRIPTGLRPYGDLDAGEVARWRLELRLNALGRAFLLVDNYAVEGSPQLTLRNPH